MQPEVSIGNESVNYKKKYKTLKRKLRMLIYEQECFAEELRKAQRKLLRISRDKSFLLDRLLQYEKPDNVPSDSEATASSDSEDEHHPPNKKKKTMISENPAVPTLNPFINQAPKSKTSIQKQSLLSSALTPTTAGVGASELNVSRKKPQKVQKKSVVKTGIKVTLPQQIMSKPSVVALTSPTKTIQVSRSLIQGQGQMVTMTQEELERHLELKQSNKSQFMSIEKTPMLPDNIFSNENSNSCDFPDSKTTDDEDLVIDMP